MWGKSYAAKAALCVALLWTAAADAQTALHLTASGRAAIWRSLGKDATDTSIATGLKVGEAVPADQRLLPFDRHVRKKVPALKPYSYTLLQGEVLIVDPHSRKIVAIVSK